MAKASKIAYELRTLPLGEHKLIDIIKIIVEADPYQKEGLFLLILYPLAQQLLMYLYLQALVLNIFAPRAVNLTSMFSYPRSM